MSYSIDKLYTGGFPHRFFTCIVVTDKAGESNKSNHKSMMGSIVEKKEIKKESYHNMLIADRATVIKSPGEAKQEVAR